MHDLFKKWFGELIEREISGLRNYCNVVEEFIDKEKGNISKKYDGLESIEHTHEIYQEKSELADFVEEHPSLSLKNHLHLDKLNTRDTSVSYEVIIVDKELGLKFINTVEGFLLKLISEVFKKENTEDT